MAEQLLIQIIIGSSTILFLLVSGMWLRMEMMHKNFRKDVSKLSASVNARLVILDRVASAITDEEFDSKLVATTGTLPSTKKIRKIIEHQFDDDTKGGRA